MSETTGLKKGLGLVHVFTIATGAMIGSGLFILPGMAHAMAGPGVIWSYVLAGLLATAGALSMSELATAMPKAGSDYFFIMRGFGAGTGSIAGMLSWFSLSLKSAFAIVGMATFVNMILHLPGLVSGAVIEPESLWRDGGMMLALTVMLALFAYGINSRPVITRFEGMVMLAGWIGYNLLLVQQA